MSRARVELAVDARPDHLAVSWTTGKHSGRARFDRVDAVPEWLGPAEDLTAGADHRTADQVLDALAAWAESNRCEVGVWGADGSVEILGASTERR